MINIFLSTTQSNSEYIEGNFDINDIYSFFKRVWSFVFNSWDHTYISVGGYTFSLFSFFIAVIIFALVLGVTLNLIRVHTENTISYDNSLYSRARSRSNAKQNEYNNYVKSKQREQYYDAKNEARYQARVAASQARRQNKGNRGKGK